MCCIMISRRDIIIFMLIVFFIPSVFSYSQYCDEPKDKIDCSDKKISTSTIDVLYCQVFDGTNWIKAHPSCCLGENHPIVLEECGGEPPPENLEGDIEEEVYESGGVLIPIPTGTPHPTEENFNNDESPVDALNKVIANGGDADNIQQLGEKCADPEIDKYYDPGSGLWVPCSKLDPAGTNLYEDFEENQEYVRGSLDKGSEIGAEGLDPELGLEGTDPELGLGGTDPELNQIETETGTAPVNIQPKGSTEICDGVDNDLDGQIDEGLVGPQCQNQAGICRGSIKSCNNGWKVCTKDQYGSDYVKIEDTRHCDGLDNDCDGSVDEGCSCKDGDTKECGLEKGICSLGIVSCYKGSWGECENTATPKIEICNGQDDDCDGLIDEDSNDQSSYSLESECYVNSCLGYIQCTKNNNNECVILNDFDSDGICNRIDNCVRESNSQQLDSDYDGLGDTCDDCIYDALNDFDKDGICGDIDNCPNKNNPNQADSDNDGVGDACDICVLDSKNNAPDFDMICGDIDNCPHKPNSDQTDCDNDGVGDVCDFDSDCSSDSDNDGINDNIDNCPTQSNNNQLDSDMDHIGDLCDPYPADPFNDEDSDNIAGNMDNCPTQSNYNQIDTDNDGVGDVCDFCNNDALNDIDSDNVCGDKDNCPNKYNPGQSDCDRDDIGDACDFNSVCSKDSDQDGVDNIIDNCVDYYNPGQADFDSDKIGDECDVCPKDKFNDADKDGICENLDNCPLKSNYDQLDSDKDSIGDACDICPNDSSNDIDHDGVCGDIDNCNLKSNINQIDCDNNGIGDACDTRSSCSRGLDSDGIEGLKDNCADKFNPNQHDRDGDGVGDVCDFCQFDALNDIDQDGICGNLDNCPTIVNQNQFDSDKDSIGNLCDKCINDPDNDFDNDQICGNLDNCPEKFNPSQKDCDNNGIGDACDKSSNCQESDGDNIDDLFDNCAEIYNPDQIDTDGDFIGDPCDLCPLDNLNDIDHDGICADTDNCPQVYNPKQIDSDKDSIGNSCDLCPRDENNDIDEDSICGDIDNCPQIKNPGQEDCEDIEIESEIFDEVIKLKREELDTLMETSFKGASEELTKKIKKSSENLRDEVVVEKKSYFVSNKKFTKYKITVDVDDPVSDLVYYQNIPKCLVAQANNIYFNGKNYHVVEEDPVIAWHFSNVQEKIEMTYEVEGEIDEYCASQVKDFIYSTSMNTKGGVDSSRIILISTIIILIIVLVIIIQGRSNVSLRYKQ